MPLEHNLTNRQVEDVLSMLERMCRLEESVKNQHEVMASRAMVAEKQGEMLRMLTELQNAQGSLTRGVDELRSVVHEQSTQIGVLARTTESLMDQQKAISKVTEECLTRSAQHEQQLHEARMKQIDDESRKKDEEIAALRARVDSGSLWNRIQDAAKAGGVILALGGIVTYFYQMAVQFIEHSAK